MSRAKAHRIRAVVRIRPLLAFESAHKQEFLQVKSKILGTKSGQTILLKAKAAKSAVTETSAPEGKEFRVDAVFPASATQLEVFDGCNVRSMVTAVCKGYK